MGTVIRLQAWWPEFHPRNPLSKERTFDFHMCLVAHTYPTPKVNVKRSEPLTLAPRPGPPSPTIALSGSESCGQGDQSPLTADSMTHLLKSNWSGGMGWTTLSWRAAGGAVGSRSLPRLLSRFMAPSFLSRPFTHCHPLPFCLGQISRFLSCGLLIPQVSRLSRTAFCF